MNTVPPEPIKPRGEPLPTAQLLKLAEFSQKDLERAIATANHKLKPFLVAKVRER